MCLMRVKRFHVRVSVSVSVSVYVYINICVDGRWYDYEDWKLPYGCVVSQIKVSMRLMRVKRFHVRVCVCIYIYILYIYIYILHDLLRKYRHYTHTCTHSLHTTASKLSQTLTPILSLISADSSVSYNLTLTLTDYALPRG
jgi:hypothetical protein